jgi:small subunit ribosomal protein S8
MDPVSNMLNGMKTANLALRESVIVPQSKLCLAIAEKLSKEGFVGTVTKKTRLGRPVFEVQLISNDRQPKITEVVRISKPSRRMYAGSADVRAVKNGKGLLVLTTPKGILTDKEARKEHVGGEVLFSIW